jgi:FkbM family methyltransferase
MLLDEYDSLDLTNAAYEPIEIALTKFFLKSDDVALDIGAHIGYFTMLMTKLCKWVYSFEPDPKNFGLLVKNTCEMDNVFHYNKAVSNEDGQVILYHFDSNSGMHRIYKSKWIGHPLIVNTVKLDNLFMDKHIDFIKMDIEGSEYGALKGMKSLLENCHPKMIMEFHPPSIEEYGASPEEEYHFLKTLGYSIRLIPKISIPISFEELDKETRKESGRNILCIKNGQSLF